MTDEHRALLRDTLMVLECLWDENDRLGSLKVDAPKDGYPRQWLVEYVRENLKPRVEAALEEMNRMSPEIKTPSEVFGPILRFLQEWEKMKRPPHIYTLHAGDEGREASLTTTDFRNALTEYANVWREVEYLRARVADLEWLNEAGCENTPTKGCECPGCGLARERAERGVASRKDDENR